jgi:hypothetical protein
VTVAVTDAQFRVGVAVAGFVLVAGITLVRFCGSVSLPPKPAPLAAQGTSSQLVVKSAATEGVYQEFLEKDASAAGVRTPTIQEMSRKLPYRVDEARHVLEVGQPAIEIAGLRLRLIHGDDALVLEITNATSSDLAYQVKTAPTPNISGCNSALALPFNAIVIAKGETLSRAECVWRDGMALAVTRVETVEVSPLSAWYLNLVPPSMLGIEDRLARGHRKSTAKARGEETCSAVRSQAVRSGLDQGQIGWRDLVDFYARHRCLTYQFPLSYRAFTSDGQLAVPAVSPGM